MKFIIRISLLITALSLVACMSMGGNQEEGFAQAQKFSDWSLIIDSSVFTEQMAQLDFDIKENQDVADAITPLLMKRLPASGFHITGTPIVMLGGRFTRQDPPSDDEDIKLIYPGNTHKWFPKDINAPFVITPVAEGTRKMQLGSAIRDLVKLDFFATGKQIPVEYMADLPGEGVIFARAHGKTAYLSDGASLTLNILAGLAGSGSNYEGDNGGVGIYFVERKTGKVLFNFQDSISTKPNAELFQRQLNKAFDIFATHFMNGTR